MYVIEPKINGALLDIYGAKMLGYSVGSVSYENGYFRAPRSMFPIRLDADVGLRTVTIRLDFEGANMMQITTNISNLTAQLHKEADLYLPDGFHYYCAFDEQSTPEEMAPWIMQVEYTMSGFRHGGLKSVKLSTGAGAKNVFIEGNYKAPVIYTVSPMGAQSFSIGDISIANVGAADVIIDGIRGKVTQDGMNKYRDATMTKFPALEPGLNTVNVVGDVDVRCDYYPLYM